jgi:SAM-dependent methyltransferase
MKATLMQNDAFFREYTSQEALVKYTRATAGFGISYLLDHDYKKVYLEALSHLPQQTRMGGIRMLEFGCGAGMNLIHLISILKREGIKVEKAIGTDFSPVLIDAAKAEARNQLGENYSRGLEFKVAMNETLLHDISDSEDKAGVRGTFHFILGVNTIRYCHAAKRQLDCARDIFQLLVPGGVCVAIDMNNRYPCFRSDLKNKFRREKEEECYVPSLEEYAAPFQTAGFELLRKKHFCWIPHSADKAMCQFFSLVSPVLNAIAPSRAMRSLVVARKPL